jgi:nucleotide-binding universal stress UspA family protein
MPVEESPIVAAFNADSSRREAVYFGLLASRVLGAPFVAVTVHRSGPMVEALGGDTDDDPHAGGGRPVEHVRVELERRGVRKPDVRVIHARRAGAGLAEAIREIEPRLVVLGTPRHRGAGGKLLGDTVEAVIHESTVPVALVPAGHHAEEGSLKVVGAAFAPTEEGRVALRTAAALARAADARLRAIEVRDGAGDSPSPELEDALSQLGVDALPEPVDGDPAGGLIAATSTVDLLVTGSRARGPRRALMLGSVSRAVAERAACPVLVVPRAAAEAAGDLLAHAATHPAP